MNPDIVVDETVGLLRQIELDLRHSMFIQSTEGKNQAKRPKPIPLPSENIAQAEKKRKITESKKSGRAKEEWLAWVNKPKATKIISTDPEEIKKFMEESE